MKKPNFAKVKSLAIASFCVFTAIANIYSVANESKTKNIVFFESDIAAEEAFDLKVSDHPEGNNNITVESDAEFKTGHSEPVANNEAKNKININSAGSEELQSLSGIGPSKAQAILEYRKDFGAFKSIEEIMEVKGIGQATYDKIKNNICI